LVAFLATLFLTPLSVFSLKKPKSWMIQEEKSPGIVHKIPVPRAGAIALFLGVFIAAYLFLPIEESQLRFFLEH